MYHELANPKTIQFLEAHAELKKFAREMCHKFNVFVMSHDGEITKHWQSAGDVTSSLRVILTKQNGLPFCVIDSQKCVDRSGKSAINYGVSSPMISKNKGRGSDRMYRESMNMKALLKTLQKDYDDNAIALDLNYFFRERNIQGDIVGLSAQNCKLKWRNGIDTSREEAEALVKYLFEGIKINDRITYDLKRKYDNFNDEQVRAEKATEIAKRFWSKCYVMVKLDHCPAVVAQATLTGGKEIQVHDGVKCYADMDEIYKDYPDFVVSLKMFNTRNQVEKQMRQHAGVDPYPIYNQIPIGFNKLDDDLDVFATKERWNGLLGMTDCQIVIVPVAVA